MLNHTGTKVIETPRLILRPFKISDASMMYQNWASDDEVTKYLTWPTHSDIFVTKTILQMWVEGYKNKDYYQWAIELKKTGEVIGHASDEQVTVKVQTPPPSVPEDKIFSYTYTFEGNCKAILTFNKCLKVLSKMFKSFKYTKVN